jgi:hypothetical protein
LPPALSSSPLSDMGVIISSDGLSIGKIPSIPTVPPLDLGDDAGVDSPQLSRKAVEAFSETEFADFLRET